MTVYATVTAEFTSAGNPITSIASFTQQTGAFTINSIDCSLNTISCYTSTDPQVGYLGDDAIFYKIKACTYTLCPITEFYQSTTQPTAGPPVPEIELNAVYNSATDMQEFHAPVPWTKGSYSFYIFISDGTNLWYLTTLKHLNIICGPNS